MEVILLEKIRNLGVLGDKVRVKPGYARNYLVPYGKAVYATEINSARFAAEREQLELAAKEKIGRALERQQKFSELSEIMIAVKSSQEGKLFGSVGTREIADAIVRMGVSVEKKEIRLSAGAIRSIGNYEVTIDLESDVVATVKLVITPEE